MKNHGKKNYRFSQTWSVRVRPSIVREFTYGDSFFDDNLAGLHEIRARHATHNRLDTTDMDKKLRVNLNQHGLKLKQIRSGVFKIT